MDKNMNTFPMQNGIVFLSHAEQEQFEERAAIMEFEGGLVRVEAEQAALDSVIKNRLVLHSVV